jgi:hypothetical protein
MVYFFFNEWFCRDDQGYGFFRQNRQEGENLVNKQLIEDTLRLLHTEMSPIAGIQLQPSPAACEQLLSVLERHDLEYNRKVNLLGIYTILTLAAERHMECIPHHPDLTRNILDGDYLYSFYLQFAVKCRELDLVAYLAPSIKKMQIRRSNGDFAEQDPAAGIEQFLIQECRQRSRTSKAI